MVYSDPYFGVIASWAQKLPRAIKIHRGWCSVRGAPMGTKNPWGHHGGGGHQNIPTCSPLGPATGVRILATTGANAFDSIAGQTNKQTDRQTGPFPEL